MPAMPTWTCTSVLLKTRESTSPTWTAASSSMPGWTMSVSSAREKEADIVVWDGGNNDLPSTKPDLYIHLADPHRACHELTYHPGESNLRGRGCRFHQQGRPPPTWPTIARVRENIAGGQSDGDYHRGCITYLCRRSGCHPRQARACCRGRPTLTHGGMAYGAGVVAAKRFGAAEIIDPRPYAVGSILTTYKKSRPPASYCRPWAMASSRCANWKRRSMPRRVIW